MNEEYIEAIDLVTRLKLKHLKAIADESNKPARDADESDHYISTHKQAAGALDGIRNLLEKLATTKDYLTP